MVLEELIIAAPELEEPIKNLVNILKIVGGVIGAYFILWLIGFAYSIRRTLLIKKMIEKLEVLEIKINKLSRKK